MKSVWKSTVIRLKTKLRLVNSNVKTVLLYGSECWIISKEITQTESVCPQMPQDHPTGQMAHEDQQKKCKGEMQPRRHHG